MMYNQLLQISLYATTIVMFGATVYFVQRLNQVREEYRSLVLLSIAILGVATIIYTIMSLKYNPGSSDSYVEQGLVTLRYIDWTFTTPLLMIKFTELLEIPRKTFAVVLALADLEMILFGYVGELPAFYNGTIHLVFGGISTIGYLVIVGVLLSSLRAIAMKADERVRHIYNRMTLFILIGWGAYPIIYLLPSFGVSMDMQVLGQCLLGVTDIINKFGFALVAYGAAVAASHTERPYQQGSIAHLPA